MNRVAGGPAAPRHQAEHQRRHHDAQPARVPRGAGASAGRLGAAAVSVSWRSTAAELRLPRAPLRREGHRLRGRPLAGRRAGARRASRPIAAKDFIVVGGGRAGLQPLRGGLPGPPAATTPHVDGNARRTRQSSSTRRARPASRRAPSASSRRTRCPRSMRFIGETPMRVDDVHLVTCPLYHSTAFGFLTFSALPRRDGGPHGRVQARGVPRSTSSATASRPRRVVPTMLAPRDGARPGASLARTTRARSAPSSRSARRCPGRSRTS